MAEENTDEWELSKENVQPLKQGRSFAQLSAALRPNTTAIRQQQERFETEIRTYDGEDPLGIWVKYISWTEQTFPKGGKGGDLQTLLKNCVIHFKDETRYHNDPRYIKIWIKFADYTTNPGQLYEFLFNQKIGCQIADFYEAWAIWLERCGNTKTADAVYSKGIEVAVQPLDRLQKRHSEFQARVARGVIESIKASGEAMEQESVETVAQRSTLGVLKPHGKTRQAPVVRISSDRPERLPRTTALPQTSGSSSIQIYNDENAVSCRLPPQNQEFTQVPFPEVVSRENQQKPSKWTGVQVKQKGAIGGSSRHTSQVPFVLHEDANIQQPLVTPHKIADGTGILSVRQEPAASNAFDGVISNTDEPNQKAMYCKEKLFVGVREFSFEELRAAHWFQKKRQEREFEERLQQEVQRQLQLALQSMNLTPVVTQFGNQLTASKNSDQLQPRIVPISSSTVVVSQNEDVLMEEDHPHQNLDPPRSDSKPILETLPLNPVPRDIPMELGDGHGSISIDAFSLPTDHPAQKSPQPAAPEALSVKKNPCLSVSSSCQDVASGATAADSADVYMATPSARADPGTQAGFEPRDASYLTKPSPTVNMKHAMEVVRNMFCFDSSIKLGQVDVAFENQFLLDSDENVCTTSGQLGKEMQASKPPAFAIYEDPSSAKLPASDTKQQDGGFKIYEDPSPPKFPQAGPMQQAGGFKIFEDPSPPKDSQPTKAFTVFEDPSPTKTSDAKQGTGAFTVYEASVPAKLPNRGMTAAGQAGQVIGRRPVPDKENIGVRRALRSLTDQDVVPPQPAAEKGPGAFIPVHQGQDDVRGAGKGATAESGAQHMTGISEPTVPGSFSVASTGVRFSDEILDEPEDVEMPDAAGWCIDDFDPTSEMNFDPKLSSTRNLTQMVRFAGTSGCPGQVPAGFRKTVSDNSGSTQLQNVQGKTFNLGNKSVNVAQKPTIKNSFFFDLDTIQEGSEESKSRGSSMDSHGSSGRPCGTGSSSGSSGSRSTLHHHLSQSSNCSAIKQSTTGCHRSIQMVSASAVADGQSYGMPAVLGDRIVGKVAHVGGVGPGINKDIDVHEHEVSFQPDESAIEEGGKGLADASVFIDQKNPYNATEIQTFLRNLSPPLSTYSNYHQVEGSLPKFAVRSKVGIGNKSYTVKAKLGEGGYARVYHIVETLGGNNDDGNAVVAKVQSPACPWEFYITTELHRRLSLRKDGIDISPSVMSIDKAFFFDDGSCFFNQRHNHGTLLDFVNSYKLSKHSIPEWLILYLSIELFHIIEQMHKCQVVHGDFKPDNILITYPRRLNAGETGLDLIRGSTSFLKLIDFGQSIDVTMFPPGTTFMTSTSEGFQCPEVQSNRPWTYQPDLFGLVATIYVLLAGKYIKVFYRNNMWSTSLMISRSSKARDIWIQMFHDFLNIPDCDSLPNLKQFRNKLEAVFLEEFSIEAYNNLVAELETSHRSS